MKKILVPLGVSANAVHTLKYALALAQSSGAQLFVMDAFTPSFHNTYILNARDAVNRNNAKRLKELIASIDSGTTEIQWVTYEGDLLQGIDALDKQVNLDIIVTGPMPNADDPTIFLGPTAGRVVKKTNLPVMVVPEETHFTPYKKALFAFKRGEVKGHRSLEPLRKLHEKYTFLLQLLLVKIPGQKRKEQQIDHEVVELSNDLRITENPTVYQGVLEHFREYQPDLLVVFARERGFFEKLLTADVVYKKDFFTKVPLLVLKNRR